MLLARGTLAPRGPCCHRSWSRLSCRAAPEPGPVVKTSEQQPLPEARQSSSPPPGCSRYTVSIKKPLGIVLEQDPKSNVISVVSVVPDGNAARSGVLVGDQLVSTSGVVYTKVADYNDVMVKQGQEIVRLAVINETFKTVSAAIGSHPGHIPVTLELQRCPEPGS